MPLSATGKSFDLPALHRLQKAVLSLRFATAFLIKRRRFNVVSSPGYFFFILSLSLSLSLSLVRLLAPP
jgi:hypothetical protein